MVHYAPREGNTGGEFGIGSRIHIIISISGIEKVRRVAEEVRAVADDGQADIGFDYIWLADVTYHDWQRYHALVGSECFCIFSCACDACLTPSS